MVNIIEFSTEGGVEHLCTPPVGISWLEGHPQAGNPRVRDDRVKKTGVEALFVARDRARVKPWYPT